MRQPEGAIATNKAYGAMQEALQQIASLPNRHSHFDGHLAATDAVAIAKKALQLVAQFEAEVGEGRTL